MDAIVKFLQAFIRQEGPVREYSFPRVKRTWVKGGECPRGRRVDQATVRVIDVACDVILWIGDRGRVTHCATGCCTELIEMIAAARVLRDRAAS